MTFPVGTGGSDLQVRGPGAPRINSRAAKRKSVPTEPRPVDIDRPNPLEEKRSFVISQITYHPTPKDHLRADNFAPCATIPFIIRLPLSTPVLTKAMVKTSCTFRREKYLHTALDTLASFVPPIPHPPTSVNREQASGSAYPPASYFPYSFAQSAFNTTPGYNASTSAPNGDHYFAQPNTPAAPGPTWSRNSAATQGIEDGSRPPPTDQDGKIFWKNQSRLAVWRAMRRLWPKIGEILDESEVNTDPPYLATFSRVPRIPREDQSEIAQGEQPASRICEDDLFPMPSMKRVSTKKIEEQLSILETITEYLGIKREHLKGSSPSDRLWLWAGNLEFVPALRKAKSAALPDSILHNIHPVLQLFDIREHFLLQFLCHHMQVMNRKFLIFGFSVTGQYAEGLLLHSLESHLINSILTVTQVRESGPKTKKEALDIITKVYDTYLEPEVVKHYQSALDHRTRDEVFENHMLLMQHSVMYLTLLDAISTASAASLLHVLSWLSAAFQSLSFPISSSLGHELIDLVAGLTREWEPPLRRAALDSMLIPKAPGAPLPALASHPASPKISGDYQEVDFAMKQLLRQTKSVFDLPDNPKHDFFREVATPNIRTISKVVRNAEESLGTAPWTASGRARQRMSCICFVMVRRESGVLGFWKSLLSVGMEGRSAEWRRRNLFFAEDFGFDWGL
ncbi:hypothetical protein HOY80DRAFT_1008575 [Tuber brumale]|nr:hypothetical protein HOY80DRAFT_1008575 [Tuber brumale]